MYCVGIWGDRMFTLVIICFLLLFVAPVYMLMLLGQESHKDCVLMFVMCLGIVVLWCVSYFIGG